MSDKKQPKHASTREYLIIRIDQWLKDNPEADDESFGWQSISDASLVGRLRRGGDVTTKKLDAILQFLNKPKI